MPKNTEPVRCPAGCGSPWFKLPKSVDRNQRYLTMAKIQYKAKHSSTKLKNWSVKCAHCLNLVFTVEIGTGKITPRK